MEALVIEDAAAGDLEDIKMSVAEATRQVNVSRVLSYGTFATAFLARLIIYSQAIYAAPLVLFILCELFFWRRFCKSTLD